MPFRVIDVETGEPLISPWTGCIIELSTGSEAQTIAKDWAKEYGRKYRVKKVLNTEWRQREQHKFNTGTYTRLPWECHSWWHDSNAIAIHQFQYPHVSRKEPGMIAYVESEEKGMENIVTRIKPGRYLEQFKDILVIYHVRAHDLVKEFDAEYAPRELRFATTEDEIQWVYENGPASCMSSKQYRAKNGWGYPEPGEWPDGYHACRAYAAGDLQVAWFAKDDEKPIKRGNVAARAVIWPEKKTYSRCYGDEYKLRDALKALGYKPAPPIGAKLLRKPYECKFIVPYIDIGQESGAGSLYVQDKGDHLVIVNRGTPLSYPASSTNGLSGSMVDASGHPVMVGCCMRCGENPVPFVHVMRDGTNHEDWCNSCVEQHAYRDAYDGRYYTPEFQAPVEMADGSIWSTRVFQARGFTCQYSGGRYNRTEAVKLGSGELWHTSFVDKFAQRCYYTGDWFKKEDLVEVMDKTDHDRRELWGPTAVRMYSKQCAGCGVRLRYDMGWNQTKCGITETIPGVWHCDSCNSPSLPLTPSDNPAGLQAMNALIEGI